MKANEEAYLLKLFLKLKTEKIQSNDHRVLKINHDLKGIQYFKK